jgi:hypothetical protein
MFGQGVLPLGCMAHVRRKFENALNYSPLAQKGLDYIGLLYVLEANLRAEGADHERIRSERMEKAWPVLQQMERWMKQVFNTITPKVRWAKPSAMPLACGPVSAAIAMTDVFR